MMVIRKKLYKIQRKTVIRSDFFTLDLKFETLEDINFIWQSGLFFNNLSEPWQQQRLKYFLMEKLQEK